MAETILMGFADIGGGHRDRTLAVARLLQEEGYEIHLCLSRRNCEIAKQNGFHFVYPVPELSWIENEYGIDKIKSGYNILFPTLHKVSLLNAFVRRYTLERDLKKKIKPKVLISDGDIAMLRLGKWWDEPYVFITNVLKPSYPGAFRAVAQIPQHMSEGYMKGAEKIIFADLPPPKTISLYNLGDYSGFPNIKFVGPFVDMRLPSGIKDENFIYVMSSGTVGNRTRFLRKISPILDGYCKKSDRTWRMTLGLRPGLIEKTDLHEVHGYVDDETNERFLAESSIVLHNGSQLTCFKAIANEKGSLVVPTKNQVEQEANARRMDELGLGVRVEERVLERELEQAIRIIDEGKDYFSTRLREFREYAEGFNGLEEAVQTIKNLF